MGTKEFQYKDQEFYRTILETGAPMASSAEQLMIAVNARVALSCFQERITALEVAATFAALFMIITTPFCIGYNSEPVIREELLAISRRLARGSAAGFYEASHVKALSNNAAALDAPEADHISTASTTHTASVVLEHHHHKHGSTDIDLELGAIERSVLLL